MGLLKTVLVIIGNAVALWIANLYVPGFAVSTDLKQLLLLALILALLNALLKPLLDALFGPVIVLTLGLGVLVVNGIILWLLPIVADHIDFLKGSIYYQPTHEIPALIATTIIVTIVNVIAHIL